MQGSRREDFTRMSIKSAHTDQDLCRIVGGWISTRSSHKGPVKDLLERTSPGFVQDLEIKIRARSCKGPLEDFSRIFTRSSQKDRCKIRQGPPLCEKMRFSHQTQGSTCNASISLQVFGRSMLNHGIGRATTNKTSMIRKLKEWKFSFAMPRRDPKHFNEGE